MRTSILLGLACLPAMLLAQSPGGVSTNLTVWYKASQGVTGNPVSSWAPSGGSASSYNLTQSSPGLRPPFLAGNANYKRYNYNPRIDFQILGNTRLENSGTSPNLYGTTGALFIVTDQNPTGGNGTLLTYTASSSTQRIQLKPSFRFQTSAGTLGYTADYAAPTEYSSSAASLLYLSGLGATATHRVNSVAIPCNNCGLAAYNPAVVNGLRLGRNGSGGEHVDCDVGEVIIYSSALTATQIDRVESYLAIKYGITRGGNTGTSSTYDYVSSTGTVIWDKTTNAGYNNDIAGIGRDDGSGLAQKQSISVNNDEAVSIGLVSIDASNAANTNSFTSNNSFVTWGNDGGVQQTIWGDPACFTSLPSGVDARIKRRWKLQLTNFSQTVTVGFETSALMGYSPLGNLRLLVDNDGGDWSNATVYTGAVLDGTRIEFAGVTLSSGSPYFTLSTTDYDATPLPVELLSFEAVPQMNAVLLRWSTATENGNDHFEVERSADGIAFHAIGIVPGAGTSSTLLEYTFFDQVPLAGMSYYRLRQVDIDGASNYSNVVPVDLSGMTGGPVILYDAHDQLALVAGYDPDTDGPITFHDLRGAHIPLDKRALDQGVIDMGTLPRGVYVVVVGGRAARVINAP